MLSALLGLVGLVVVVLVVVAVAAMVIYNGLVASGFCQAGAVAALRSDPGDFTNAVAEFERRRDAVVKELDGLPVVAASGGWALLLDTNAMGIPPETAPRKDAYGFPDHTPGLQPFPSITLGSATVSPINMANGFATIANGGRFHAPYIIDKVVDKDGQVLYDHSVSDEQAIDEDQGVDIAADVSYALQQAVDQVTHAELSNSPRHVAKARISVPGPMRSSFISVEAQYLSSRTTLARARLAGATTFSLNVVQPLSPAFELSGGLRNLFDVEYADPASSQHRQDSLEQNGRTAQVGLRWKLWTK